LAPPPRRYGRVLSLRINHDHAVTRFQQSLNNDGGTLAAARRAHRHEMPVFRITGKRLLLAVVAEGDGEPRGHGTSPSAGNHLPHRSGQPASEGPGLSPAATRSRAERSRGTGTPSR